MTVSPASSTVNPTDGDRPPAPGPFSGWRILAITVATAILTGPGQTIGVSVFIDPMVATLGVSRSAVSTAYLVGTLAGASAMPVFGRFVDRRGVRLAQTLVGLGFTVALINMASVQNIVWLAIGFGGIRMMGQGALSMITTVTVSLWFERRRGVAMGILATVSGAGIVAVPLALNAVISATSWRVAWLIAAATILATVVPLGWFGLISRPADVGQLPDGMQHGQLSDEMQDRVHDRVNDTVNDGVNDTVNDRVNDRVNDTVNDSPRADGIVTPVWTRQYSFTRGEAIRTRQFWILSAVTTMTGMLITGLNFHQIDLLSEAGLSSGEAAAMFLPQIIGSSVTGISVGYLIDRVGVRFVPATVMLLLIGVHLLGAALQPGVVVFIYAVSLGATGGAGRACLSTMLPGYFGTGHIGSIQGVMTVTGVAGSAIGPVTLSLVEGRLGSYQAANLALLILPAVTLLATLTNRAPSVRAEG